MTIPHTVVGRGPVRVIVDQHDGALGEQTMKGSWLRHLPSGELELLANAGHYSMFETPVALVTSVEKTLSAIPA